MTSIIRHLRDGRTVLIRSMEPRDIQLVDEMHDRLSPISLYYRYLTASKPSLTWLRSLLKAPNSMGITLVAEFPPHKGQIVGVACYVRQPEDPTIAEPGLLVEDRFQGVGLGRLLLHCLLEAAADEELTEFKIYVHPENSRMLILLDQCGFPAKRRYWDCLYEICMPLGATS